MSMLGGEEIGIGKPYFGVNVILCFDTSRGCQGAFLGLLLFCEKEHLMAYLW